MIALLGVRVLVIRGIGALEASVPTVELDDDGARE